jgi:CubicO group peptidase (beta-lactamase class C family)
MKKTIILFLIGITFSSCTEKSKEIKPLSLSENQKIKNSLTSELDSIQQNGQLIGFAVAIVNQEGTLYEKGFGYSNIETKEKYTEHTIQHIASVSKTLIGIALMKAQEMGTLNLDDSIQKYLPFKIVNPFHPNNPITIRHLATHTSGINDTEQYMENAWVITENQDLSNISSDYPDQRLNPSERKIPMEEYLAGYLVEGGNFYQNDNYINFKPGERYNYSNIGATLAALVLEKATKQPFDSFTKEYILKPLAMNSTGWSLKDVDISKHSRLYRNDNSVLPFYTAITYPDGMLISSSSDIAKYLTELIKGFSGEGTLLKKESYVALFKEQLNENNFAVDQRRPNHPYDGDYSPAIFIGHSALGYVGHSGGDAGVGTWMYFNKKTKTGRYIVKNTDSGNDNRAKELEYYAIWDKMDEYIGKLDQ